MFRIESLKYLKVIINFEIQNGSFSFQGEMIMTDKSEELIPSRAILRESDNPIVEEYKEDMLRKPTYGARPTLDSEERLCRLEGLLGELHQKLEALEMRLKALEGRK